MAGPTFTQFIGTTLAILGGAIAMAGGATGSSLGCALTGRAGCRTMAEDPTQARNAIVLAALPMTQTFYGLVVLLLTIVLLGLGSPISMFAGIAAFAAGLIYGIGGCISAIKQGEVCAAGIVELPRTKGKVLTWNIILGAYVETFAVISMVASILVLVLAASPLKAAALAALP